MMPRGAAERDAQDDGQGESAGADRCRRASQMLFDSRALAEAEEQEMREGAAAMEREQAWREKTDAARRRQNVLSGRGGAVRDRSRPPPPRRRAQRPHARRPPRLALRLSETLDRTSSWAAHLVLHLYRADFAGRAGRRADEL